MTDTPKKPLPAYRWPAPEAPEWKDKTPKKHFTDKMNADAFARYLETETPEQERERKAYAQGKPPPPPPDGGDPIDPILATFDKPLTESDIADAFVEAANGNYLFDQKQGCWFRWGTTHWIEDGTKLAFETIRRLGHVATATLKPGRMKEFRKAGFARGVEAFARCDPRCSIVPGQWDSDPDLLGTPGGTVNLKTGHMRPGNPRDMISKLTGVAPVAGPCPQWLEFLEEATGGDLDMIAFIKRWLGYSLTGHNREEQLAFFYGPGGNGKGTLLSVATRLIGQYAVTAPMHIFLSSQHERHSTDLAMLRGARFVTAQETKSGQQWDEERMKMLTGGDIITARFMRQDNFSFMPQFTLTMSANNAPTLNHVDDAIRRRFNVVPFIHKPKAVDKKLKERLIREEGPQILGWMIEGAVEWHREGLGEAAAIKKASEDYFGAQDIIGQWLDEECERDRLSKEGVSKLYRHFTNCQQGEGRSLPSQKAFSQDLVNKRGFTRMRDMYGACIVGIRLNSPDMT